MKFIHKLQSSSARRDERTSVAMFAIEVTVVVAVFQAPCLQGQEQVQEGGSGSPQCHRGLHGGTVGPSRGTG